jgi:hypothetical protein
MWVQDIKGAVTALAAEHPGTTFALLAPARFGKAAIFAAVLDSRIQALHASLPAVSIRREAKRGGLSDIPRILSVIDLPQAVKLIAPRPVWLEFAEGSSEPGITAAYGATKATFRATQGSDLDWDAVANWLSR